MPVVHPGLDLLQAPSDHSSGQLQSLRKVAFGFETPDRRSGKPRHVFQVSGANYSVVGVGWWFVTCGHAMPPYAID